MQSKTIIEADDFAENNEDWETLLELKQAIPNFKITLFTVIGVCSFDWVRKMQGINWIDLVPHGLFHKTPRECENWSFGDSNQYLRTIKHFNLTRGFKAPGWQISDGMYEALIREGYWVADQPYNNNRRPEKLPVYLHYPANWHFHIGKMFGECDNRITKHKDKIISELKDKDFSFIKDII